MLKSFLFGIKDNRTKKGRRYELGYVLLFSIFAITGGADSYRKIHTFIRGHYETLKDKFGLRWKRIPAYTTIRNIIRSLSLSDMEECFREYSLKLSENEEGSGNIFVACDGKTLRGSIDNFRDKKAIRILSAFLPENGIILAHCEVSEKTNEIPVAQKLMTELGLENRIFTFDAMNCQEKTLKAAKESNNDVIVCVKGNQKILLSDCKDTCELRLPCSEYEEPLAKERNRIESRKVGVFDDMIITDGKWEDVRAIVKVERKREIFDTKEKQWKNTDETSYYISTVSLSAEEFCKAIRNHWGIENRNHYVKDVTMNEDKSRIRDNPHIFARLKSFALNILRANGVSNIASELFYNCINLNNILNYRGINEN